MLSRAEPQTGKVVDLHRFPPFTSVRTCTGAWWGTAIAAAARGFQWEQAGEFCIALTVCCKAELSGIGALCQDFICRARCCAFAVFSKMLTDNNVVSLGGCRNAASLPTSAVHDFSETRQECSGVLASWQEACSSPRPGQRCTHLSIPSSVSALRCRPDGVRSSFSAGSGLKSDSFSWLVRLG